MKSLVVRTFVHKIELNDLIFPPCTFTQEEATWLSPVVVTCSLQWVNAHKHTLCASFHFVLIIIFFIWHFRNNHHKPVVILTVLRIAIDSLVRMFLNCLQVRVITYVRMMCAWVCSSRCENICENFEREWERNTYDYVVVWEIGKELTDSFSTTTRDHWLRRSTFPFQFFSVSINFFVWFEKRNRNRHTTNIYLRKIRTLLGRETDRQTFASNVAYYVQ